MTGRCRFRTGRESDVDAFLGEAIRDSERAHTGVGIWDVAIGDDENPDKSLTKVLAHACKNDENCHFHYSHFLIGVVDTAENDSEEIVAAGCGFIYPDFCVRKSYPGMSLAARLLRGISEEESNTMWDKISFLDVVFPDHDYDNTWMLESIVVAPSHRKEGIAVELINQLFELGRSSGARECLVVCAIGNIAAYRTYEKAGFECLGQGESEEALITMKYPGFHLFRKKYNS